MKLRLAIIECAGYIFGSYFCDNYKIPVVNNNCKCKIWIQLMPNMHSSFL